MSARRSRYTPLSRDPHSESRAKPDHELDAAFDLSDDENEDEQTESTPLTRTDTSTNPHRPIPTSAARPTVSIPITTSTPISIPIPSQAPGSGTATYDFERDYEYDYDFPPPGSPPGPSTTARPNDYGNSNGLIPSSPVASRPWPSSQATRLSFLRRAIGTLWPRSQYARVPVDAEAPPEGAAQTRSAPRGGGIENDGVFANVMAKPGRAVEARDENGEVYMVPEEAQKEMPPSYTEAQADAAPSYWETTVHAPLPLDADSDMIVDDLPTGSLIIFASTAFISYFFSFVGFVLTYLLHTTHAAKYGSRAGLGITLIQYGFFSRAVDEINGNTAQGDADGSGGMAGGPSGVVFWNITSGTSVVIDKADIPAALTAANGTLLEWGEVGQYNISSRDWLSLLFMTLGWFLLLSSLVGFYRVKRWEYSIRGSSSSSSAPSTSIYNPWVNPFATTFGSSSSSASASAPGADAAAGETGLEQINESMRREAEVRARLEHIFGISGAARRGTDMGLVTEAEEDGQRRTWRLGW